MVIQVDDKGRSENGGNNPEHRLIAKIANIGRKEKKLHHQFFKVVVITVPKIDHGFRQKRFIGVAKNIETENPQQTYPQT